MHKIQIWFDISVANLLKAHGKGFTPTLDATAGTHSCLNRMLMKEKHRKSRGFGSSWRTHTHTPHICAEMAKCSPLSECITAAVMSELYVNRARRSLEGVQSEWCCTPLARLIPAELNSQIQETKQLQVQRERPRRQSHRSHTAQSNKPPHMLMKVCSPTTAHMRPRQLKPQPHGPPGLCELPLPHSLPLHSHITR